MAVGSMPDSFRSGGARALNRLRAVLVLPFVLTVLGFLSAAQAATLSPEVANGLTWLSAQVQADGSLAGESTSVATPLQCRSEAALTLAILASAPATLTSRVMADDDVSTEAVARKAMVAGSQNVSANGVFANLLALQNADGGFAGASGYASGSLDTALALAAFRAQQTGGVSATQVSNALGQLALARIAGAGWGVDQQSCVHITALALLAAHGWHNEYAVASTTMAARDWLLSARTNGSYGNVLDDAFALLALGTQTTDTTVLQPLTTSLLAAQRADGSWDGDPYLTAVVLRALWASQNTPPAATTGSVTGVLVDVATGVPVGGATVQLVEAPELAAASAVDGLFLLTGVVPGQYTLRITKASYAVVSGPVDISAGVTTNVGTLRLTAAPLTATLTGTIKNTNGQALAGAVVAVGTATALTDAQGGYTLTAIPPGIATISVTAYGYTQVASAPVEFTAGAVYVFSPTMYTGAPPATVLKGKIVDVATGTGIVGATVQVGSLTATTTTGGAFSLAGVSTGAFTLTASATGYVTVAASGALVAGSNDIGTLFLGKPAASTTLSGKVTDVQSGAPIAGATVATQGFSATTAADGSYTIPGIATTAFDLTASAAGYLALTQHVSLNQPGGAVVNLALTMLQPSGIAIESVTTGKSNYLPSEVLQVQVALRNTTTQALDAVVDALVMDANSNVVLELKANAHGPGNNPLNLPVSIPAADTLKVDLSQLLLRRNAGTYTILARAYDITGRAVAEAHTNFTVAAQAMLGGGVIVDPPLTQAGAQTPIHFTAQASNLGNQPIPAGELMLTVTLDYPDTQVATLPQTDVKTLASGAPFHYLRGLARDSAGNLYSVAGTSNDGRVFKTAPDGTISVAVQIPATNYPNLTDVAIDNAGTFWLSNYYSGIVWRVDSQGALTKIVLSNLDNVMGVTLDAQGNLLLTGQKAGEHRLIKRDNAGTETVLWANGLSAPIGLVKDASGDLIVTNNADGTVSRIRPSGEIVPFVRGLNRPMGVTKDGAGNFYVADNGDGTISKVTALGVVSTYATGLQGPADLQFDATGILFVTCQTDNAIRKVASDGSVSIFSKGIANQPYGLKYDSTGNLFIANLDGTLRKYGTDGQLTVLASGLRSPYALALDRSGVAYVTEYSAGRITKVDGSTSTTFASGLSSPQGISVGNNDEVLVVEYGKNRLSRYDTNGLLQERIPSLLNRPESTTVDRAGNVIVVNGDGLTIIESGVPRRFYDGTSIRYLAPDRAGNAVFILVGYDLYRVTYAGVATKLNATALPVYAYGITADGAGDLLLADYSGRKIYKRDAAGNLTVLATTTANPRYLTGDGLGKVYVLFADHTLHLIADDGTLTPLSNFYTAPNYDYPSGLGVAADGRPLVWTSNGKVIAIDPVTGTQSVVRSGVSGASGATMDAMGNLYLAFYDHQLVTYDAAGVETNRLSGFVNPADIVWDGSEYWFVDSGHTYSLAAGAGQYPLRRASQSMTGLAVTPAGDLLGVSGRTISRWNGSGYTAATSVQDLNYLAGIAVRADGAISVADYSVSQIRTFDSGLALLASYSGVLSPTGLRFDAAGRLYVASTGTGAIARFDAGATTNSVPTYFAKLSNPNWLDFDAQGLLWVSNGSVVSRIDTAGVATQVSTGTAFRGLLVDGPSVYGVNSSGNQVQRWDGSAWNAFAAGLAYPEGVRVLGDGGIALVNRSNGTLVKLTGGSLDVLTNGLVNPHALDVASDGQTIYVAGDQGTVTRVDPIGAALDLNVASLVGTWTSLYGLNLRADGAVMVSSYGSNTGSIFEIFVRQPAVAPAPGTVVLQRPMAAPTIPVGESISTVDFGSWVAPYGGDYSVRVDRAGLLGSLESTAHVGPFAEGRLSVGTPRVAPGNQTVPLQLKLTGADFTSIARVETSLVKPAVMGVRPNGMAADKAGNIYATDGGNLRKTTPLGVETIIASGYSFGLGMAIDSAERLYIPITVAGKYQLARFTLAGQATVLVADLGGTPAGVAVNSQDVIFVGMPNRLLQVTQDGVASLFASAGIPSPVGISIDGKDNIFVLNYTNLVTQIKPDRSARVLYNKGDGVDHPWFEYEGMALAADCGENIYLTPFVWAAVDQNGEEYTLAQVNPRTGVVKTVLDGRKIHYDLLDMDYIVFDRFGSRLLMWTDYSGGRIWQVPVTCGAISADAHLVTKPGQTLTGANRAPAATIPLANGGTEYVWSLRDITATGVSIGFDTLLKNLALGETRQVIDSGYLQFKNSFSPNDIKMPVAIPSVQVENLVALAVSTDQPQYDANGIALVETQLTNTRAWDVSGTLVVEVLDASGILVGQVAQQGVTIAANDVLPVSGSFAIGSIVPATYTVRATLTDNGQALAQASAPFTVLGDSATGTAVSQLTLDRGGYDAADRVSITARAVSKSANVVLENLTLGIVITDAAGAVQYSKDIAIAQLLAGATIEFTSQYAFTGAPAGTYTVTQTLKDSGGATLDTQVKTYTVAASDATGFGLGGTLGVNPRTVPVGAPVGLNYGIVNRGNAAYTGLSVKLRIVDPVKGTALTELPLSLDLPVGGSQAGNQTWTTQGSNGDALVAVLVALVGGKEIALAQESFTLSQVQTGFELKQSVSAKPRLLVLAACSGHGEGNEADHDDHDNSHDHGVVSRVGQTSRSSCDHDGDGHDDSSDDDHHHDQKCGLGRAQSIDTLLNGLGVAHRVTTDPAIFRDELRTGAYNAYWVSGQVSKLKDDLAEELREAAWRGEGLLLDGVHDERNQALDTAAGIRWRGKQGQRNQALWLNPPIFSQASLPTLGRALKADAAGAEVAGRLGSLSGTPAVFANPYGNGRVMLFGVDVVASLPADPHWPGTVNEALTWLLPPAATTWTPGGYLPVTTTVTNTGAVTADVQLKMTLPAGSAFIDSTPAPTQPPAGAPLVALWQFSLGQGQSQTVDLALRAPATPGTLDLTTLLLTCIAPADFAPYGEPHHLSLSIVGAISQLAATEASIATLSVTGNADKSRRKKAADKVEDARKAIAKRQWNDAIEDLIDAIDQLTAITTAPITSVTALRLTLDQALKEVELRSVGL